MPWASAEKSRRAVKGCFGAAKGDPKKKAKCAKMGHEAKAWRKGKRMSSKRARK